MACQRCSARSAAAAQSGAERELAACARTGVALAVDRDDALALERLAVRPAALAAVAPLREDAEAVRSLVQHLAHIVTVIVQPARDCVGLRGVERAVGKEPVEPLAVRSHERAPAARQAAEPAAGVPRAIGQRALRPRGPRLVERASRPVALMHAAVRADQTAPPARARGGRVVW